MDIRIDRIATLTLSGLTIPAIAEAIQCSEQTIAKIKQSRAYAQTVEERQNDGYLSDFTGRIGKLIGEAVGAIELKVALDPSSLLKLSGELGALAKIVQALPGTAGDGLSNVVMLAELAEDTGDTWSVVHQDPDTHTPVTQKPRDSVPDPPPKKTPPLVSKWDNGIEEGESW